MNRRKWIRWRLERGKIKGGGQVKLCTDATSSGGFLKLPACEQFQAGHEYFAACEQFQVNTNDLHEQCLVNISKWKKSLCIMPVNNNK